MLRRGTPPQQGKRSNNSSEEASEFTTVRLDDYLELKNLVKLTMAELNARIPSAKKKKKKKRTGLKSKLVPPLAPSTPDANWKCK